MQDCTGEDIGSGTSKLDTCELSDDSPFDNIADPSDDTFLGPEDVFQTESCSDPDKEDDGSASCFAADSTVRTESGAVRRVSEVKVGDRVEVVDAQGVRTFADVVFVPHASDNSDPANFVTLKLATGE
jgi:hypothetical protein